MLVFARWILAECVRLNHLGWLVLCARGHSSVHILLLVCFWHYSVILWLIINIFACCWRDMSHSFPCTCKVNCCHHYVFPPPWHPPDVRPPSAWRPASKCSKAQASESTQFSETPGARIPGQCVAQCLQPSTALLALLHTNLGSVAGTWSFLTWSMLTWGRVQDVRPPKQGVETLLFGKTQDHGFATISTVNHCAGLSLMLAGLNQCRLYFFLVPTPVQPFLSEISAGEAFIRLTLVFSGLGRTLGFCSIQKMNS